MKRKYVLVGTGSRCSMYIDAICGDFSEYADLLALCDSNETRRSYYQKKVLEKTNKSIPTYAADEFDKMIYEMKPDSVIVTTMDRTHHKYICRAMELGCDVITEKPMTVDAEKCQQIIDVQKKTYRNITVTFNYRYSPRNTKIKELLQSGICGEVTSVTFEWLLDTSHGADYFRRWHRNKNNSGGLLVHKSTHHFDLMNWWLSSTPDTVFCMADLKFYGKENAEKRGVTQFYSRARGSEIAKKDPFALKYDEEKDEILKELYYNAEHEDSYYRDQSVFGDGISIEDNMNVMVRYKNNCVMNYSLYAHAPWEGYRVCFNGTKGRLQFNVVEKSYISGEHEDFNQPGMRELEETEENKIPEIIFQPLWGKPYEITYEKGNKGGHGGGDVRLLKNIFVGVENDIFGHVATYVDGAESILTGIAANQSIKTGMPVKVDTLIKLK